MIKDSNNILFILVYELNSIVYKQFYKGPVEVVVLKFSWFFIKQNYGATFFLVMECTFNFTWFTKVRAFVTSDTVLSYLDPYSRHKDSCI